MAVITEPASSNALQLGPSRLKQQIIGSIEQRRATISQL
jgi:hypothetical protein